MSAPVAAGKLPDLKSKSVVNMHGRSPSSISPTPPQAPQGFRRSQTTPNPFGFSRVPTINCEDSSGYSGGSGSGSGEDLSKDFGKEVKLASDREGKFGLYASWDDLSSL
jgi:hypothetical protein